MSAEGARTGVTGPVRISQAKVPQVDTTLERTIAEIALVTKGVSPGNR